MIKKLMVSCISLVGIIALAACSPATSTVTSISTTTATVTGTTTITVNTCTSTETTTVTSTAIVTSTVTLPTTTTTLEQVSFPDQGIIRVYGKFFNYQKMPRRISETIEYNGVIFAPYNPAGPGTTITVPIMYWFTIKFPDGITEQLSYIGLPMGLTPDGTSIDIKLGDHNNPTAGIMAVWQTVGGSLRMETYFLVGNE